uniref:[histone H3]-lysine(4) N-methyltransferase n=1 Tax=Astyanax mexicanus TaxID=7994 RepID=A0A8B9J7L2_ASTMX
MTKQVNTRRRGRSADKKADPIPQRLPETEAGEQKVEEKLRKSARKSQPAPGSDTVEAKTDEQKVKPTSCASKENAEVKKLVIRRRNRTESTQAQEAGDKNAEGRLAESLLEVSTIEETVPPSKKKKGKKKKRHRKDKVSENVRGNHSRLSEQPSGDSTDLQSIEKEFVGIPGLKLTRIRNPKARSRKKRPKFIWTLTLVKCKSKTINPPHANLSKAPESLSKETESPSKCADGVDVSTEPTLTSDAAEISDTQNTPQPPENKEPTVEVIPETQEHAVNSKKDEEGKTPRKSKEDVETCRSEAVDEVNPEEVTQTDVVDVAKNQFSKDSVQCPPLQVKVAASPRKHNHLKQPSPIQKDTAKPELKDLSTEAETELHSLAEVPENQVQTTVPPMPKVKPKLRQTTHKRNRRHKPWSVQKRKKTKTPTSNPKLQSKITAEPEIPLTEAQPQPEPELEPEPKPEELPTPREQPKPKKCSRQAGFSKSRRTVPRKTPQALPALEGHLSCEAPLAEATEPTITDSAALPQPHPLTETQTDDVKPEESKAPSTKAEAEILVLEPPATEEARPPRPVKKPFKVRKRRRSLIGQRFRPRNQKLPGKSIAKENRTGSDACSPTGASEPAGPKLVGILKTKYKMQQVPKSLPHSLESGRNEEKFLAQQAEKEPEVPITDEDGDKGAANERADLDSSDVQPGKTKFVKNIKHFIMPVVSARSSRVIKTPKRFMDDSDMSDLPRRQKKCHLLAVPPKGKKQESKAEPVDSLDLESLCEDTFPGKRRSLLRDPSFNWQVLEPVGAEVYNFDQDIEKEYEALLSAKDFPFDSLIDPSPKKKKSFKKQSSNLKMDKKLTDKLPDKLTDKLNFGLCSKNQKIEKRIEKKTTADAPGPEKKGTTQRPLLTGANKHMLNLLKKAKVQLIKIDQQKQLASSGPPDGENRGGPRIKHVCRAAAVVLGQPRAIIPDDIPRLSALPLHERSGISPSPSHSDPDSPVLQRTPKFRKVNRGGVFGLRSRRCGECKGCLHEEDCGTCLYCLDKTKFGGPNTKRQCCECSDFHFSWSYLLTVGFFLLGQMKRRHSSISAGHSSNEEGEGTEGAGRSSPTSASVGDSQSPSLRKQPRRHVKPRSYCDLLDYDSDLESVGMPQSTSPGRRRVPGPRNTGNTAQEVWYGRGPSIEDCGVHSVWSAGGMSILTSVPLMPQSVCLLCASRGQHEMLYCQVCCEPFHPFCLDPSERPQEENKENWCCRRCKFCRVCGRKNKPLKPLLECERCQNCYHPACLGPNYPKPNRRKRSWVCMTCIRCKSCGVTPGKSWDTEWDQDKGLCPDCTRLYEQGNYCTMCFKCYEDNDYESQMMQCSSCNHWVHAKCEGLTDDLYEILSSLPESVVYSCQPCIEAQPAGVQESESAGGWRELLMLELRAGVEKVLACLLSSTLTQHLLLQDVLYWAFNKFAHPRPGVLERGGINILYTAVVCVKNLILKNLSVQLMEEVFSWFNSQDPKVWDPRSKHLPTGMLLNAILPPTNEHVYAQWREHEEKRRSSKSDLDTGWSKDDERQCVLCQKYGDAKSADAGRLLYLGQNEWAHVNCSMWSAEVFEEDNGCLMHVHSAVARGRLMRCERCNQTGATVGCCLTSCQSNYHFMCARSRNCVFQDDKTVFCYKHRDLISGQIITGQGFEVLRRVYVDFEGISLRRKFLTGLEPESINMKIGSLLVSKLGKLNELSASQGKLVPVGYECSRWYWSAVNPHRRCKYTCRVMEVRPAVQEKPVEEFPNQGENRTIAHSPCPQSGRRGLICPTVFATCIVFFEVYIFILFCLCGFVLISLESGPIIADVTPANHSSELSFAKPELSTAKPKSSVYSQSRRPAGGLKRPLPSPGNVFKLTLCCLLQCNRLPSPPVFYEFWFCFCYFRSSPFQIPSYFDYYGNVPEKKKPQKKKETQTPRKPKTTPLPTSSCKTSDNHSESAQAILNQAMASYYDPNRSGARILSPSTPRSSSAGGKAPSASSVVLPPGLLVKSEPTPTPPATPLSPSSRPKQVRMKRVSSLSDRIATKKSKSDFVEPELSSVPEEQRKLRMMSCSDDETPPSDNEDQFLPRGDQPHLRFKITSDDGFSVEADSIEVAWRAVLDGVQEARAAAKLRQLSFTGMNGARMMGLLHDAVVYLVEQLQGASSCHRHPFRFHKQASQEEDLPINPSGCARSEVYLRKSTFDMFNFLASQHRQLPDTDLYDEEEDDVLLKSSRRATSLELPMAMRFRHLERTSKEAVGVYRSAIHGRGLFCKRNIEAGEMVIEYSGIVIRSVLTDKREKYYDGKGIGCYMFRIDDFDVVDATMHGNAARFINHSCEPNCYSRVINVEGQKHIVIFALRKIYRGEELTYDYKFPIEDASNKLGCNCGARRCRRFLN